MGLLTRKSKAEPHEDIEAPVPVLCERDQVVRDCEAELAQIKAEEVALNARQVKATEAASVAQKELVAVRGALMAHNSKATATSEAQSKILLRSAVKAVPELASAEAALMSVERIDSDPHRRVLAGRALRRLRDGGLRLREAELKALVHQVSEDLGLGV